jgi:hypothetical protein
MSETTELPKLSATWLQCLGLSKRHAEAVVESHERMLADEAMKTWGVKLQLNRVEEAAKHVIRSARKASREQDLVHRPELLTLAREVGEPLNTTI